VLITGGSRGIGRAASLLFAQRGYAVAINYIKDEQSAVSLRKELLASGFTADIYQFDVSKPDEVNRAAAAIAGDFGRISVLVNNAGISGFNPITDITDNEWQLMLSVNLTGAFNCSRAVLPYMLRTGGGAIVNVSSMWGISGGSCEAHYSAAKAGVIGLTKALAKELGPSNITVNCVAPGLIQTDMNSRLSPEELEQLRLDTPLMRIGKPEDAAQAILFLAESDFITGQVLAVDGGFIL